MANVFFVENKKASDFICGNYKNKKSWDKMQIFSMADSHRRDLGRCIKQIAKYQSPSSILWKIASMSLVKTVGWNI